MTDPAYVPSTVAELRRAQTAEREARAALALARRRLDLSHRDRRWYLARRAALGLLLAALVAAVLLFTLATVVVCIFVLVLLGHAGEPLHLWFRRHRKRWNRLHKPGSGAQIAELRDLIAAAEQAHAAAVWLLLRCERDHPPAVVWPAAGYDDVAAPAAGQEQS